MRPDYNKLFVRLYTLCACLAIGLAFAVTAGGEKRFSGPSFNGPRALVEYWVPPGYAHWVWGLMFLCHGLWLVFAMGRRMAVHALRFGIVTYTFLALSFGGSVASTPTAAGTGVVAYLIFAAIHLYLSDHLTSRGWGAV